MKRRTLRRSVSHKVISFLKNSFILVCLRLFHHYGFYFNAASLLHCGLTDDPVPRQSTQAQAAEDILDKYRNIKRTSPSDGATGGTSYDGSGGLRAKLPLVYLTHESIRDGN